MNTRAMVIIAVSILAACSNRKSNQTLILTVDKEALKAFVDKSNAAGNNIFRWAILEITTGEIATTTDRTLQSRLFEWTRRRAVA